MHPDPLPRRAFVGALGTGVAALWLAGPLPRAVADPAPRPPAAPDAPPLTAEELRDLDAITAQLLPSDDTPGAREAQVMTFITAGLEGYAKEQVPLFAAGLAALAAQGGARFADLPGEVQERLLHELDAARDPFFEAVRAATLSGFLCNPEYGGNANKVGWQLLGFEDRYVWAEPFGYYDAAPPR